jgi:drug/metabolite transporter (DMT)-like permease
MFSKNENLNGIILMTFSMFGFAMGDTALKLTTKTVPIGEAMALMGIGSSLIFYAIIKISGGPLFNKSLFEFPMMLRNFGDALATIGIFIALSLIPLTTLAAIMQALPLLVIIAAVIFLKEKVGYRRWIAVVAGLIGMIFIVRPGSESFNIYTLFAVLGVLGMTIRDIGSRLAPRNIKTEFMAFYASLMCIPIGLVIILIEGTIKPITLIEFSYILILVITGTFSYHTMTIAVRLGDISAIAPIRYTRLFFAMVFGALIFNEVPDKYTLIGAGIIVISGLYAFIREARLNKTALKIND